VRVPKPDASEIVVLHDFYVDRFTNRGACPVCVLGQCFNGKFDVSRSNTLGPNVKEQDCIPWCVAWGMVGLTSGGAVAVLSNNNTCYGVPGDQNANGIPDDAEMYGGFLAVEIFRLYGEEEKRILGEIFAASVKNYVDQFPVHGNMYHHKSVTEWTLIGDPTLRIGGYE
jgi:hypothetical protein